MTHTVQRLQARLAEAEELLRAIRSGEVDALVVSGPLGDQVYTRSGADHPYRVMVEAMSEGAVILTADGTIHYSNRSFAAMLDAPLEEVIGSKMGRFVLAEDVPRFNTLTHQIDVGIKKGEIRLTAKGGSVVPVQLSISALDSGTSRSACAVVTDLTAHKRHEALISVEALERAKRVEADAGMRRIASILESITENFFGLSKDWRFTYLNSHAAAQMRILGKDPDSLIGKVLWDEFPDVPNEPALRRVMSERVAITDELYYAPLGEWVENHMYPSGDGGTISFQKYVSERKRAEAKLRRSESLLAEGQRISHTGSWVFDVARGELFWSLEHFRICGIDPATFTLTPETARQLIHRDDRISSTEDFERAVAERVDFDCKLRMVRPDGAIRWVHSRGHPVFNESGDATEYVGTVMDITERREADEERSRLLRQVVQAQEDERRRIALEMHDEFGQQLTALVLKLSALKRTCGRRVNLGQQLASSEAIARQLDRDLEQIIWRLRPTTLDDLGLVAALTNYVKRWSDNFDVHAEFHTSGVAPDWPTDEIDTALYRITQEALNNVAKHAQARHVAILLDRRFDRVSLIVEDDGIGFDVQSAGPHQRFGVVGMRERATILGGTLDIESDPGKGATVVARIPVPANPERKQP